MCCVPCSLANVKPNGKCPALHVTHTSHTLTGSDWCDGVGVFLREATNQGDWTTFSVTKTGCHRNRDSISMTTVVIQSSNKVQMFVFFLQLIIILLVGCEFEL